MEKKEDISYGTRRFERLEWQPALGKKDRGSPLLRSYVWRENYELVKEREAPSSSWGWAGKRLSRKKYNRGEGGFCSFASRGPVKRRREELRFRVREGNWGTG